MLTGADVRKYRKLVGLNQVEFAAQLGLAQSTLSLIEGGRISVSDDHVQQLEKKFAAPAYKPSFDEFLGLLERDRSEAQAAVKAPRGRHLTLTVWRWEDGFDLSRTPAPEQAADLITVTATENPAIALRMDRRTEWWSEGETLVFEQYRQDAVHDGDICLVQIRLPRGRGTKTMIAVAHLAPAKRGRSLQLEPISPPGPIFGGNDDNVLALMVATHSSRRLR